MVRLGIIFDKIGVDQITVGMIKRLDSLKEGRPDLSICLFAEEQSWAPVPIKFPILPIAEAYFADYTMVANNVGTANKLLKFPNAAAKYFFVHNPDWLYVQNKRFSNLYNIYGNEKLKLVVPSVDYSNIIEKSWNRKPEFIIEGFNLQKFMEII